MSTSSAAQGRLMLTVALERYMGRECDSSSVPNHLIQHHTGIFTDGTCAVLATAIGTDYELHIMDFIYAGDNDGLAVEYARLVPDYNNEARWDLNDYLKNLQTYRHYLRKFLELGGDLSNVMDDFSRLLRTANAYRATAGISELPFVTQDERLLIDFFTEHPDLIESMFHQLSTTDLDQEFLDRIIIALSPLVTGTL